MASASVVIVGGGISGCAIAYFLARRGRADVLLLEARTLGSGTTSAAAGGIRAQFSTEINIRCSRLSLPFWERFEAETGAPHRFGHTGYLLLATTAAEYSELARSVALQNRLGVPSRMLTPQEVQALVPALNTSDLAGASYNADDGVGTPYDALQGYIRAAQARGVMVREHARIEAVERAAGHVTGVRLADGEFIATETVVDAAGPWSGEVGAMAGLHVPVRPFRRELYVSEPFPAIPPGPLVMDLHTAWYYRHEGHRILMAGIADPFSSWNTSLDRTRLPEVAARAVHRVPALARASFTGGWAGSYDISPDNHALLGSYAELRGFICACGFSGHGYMHSPATGMLVSELILEGRTTSLDISPLRPARFREGEPLMERLTSHRDLLDQR
jgi:sarcosine oxidase subunit beta